VANHKPHGILFAPFKITIREQVLLVSSTLWRQSYQVYAALQLEASEIGKLEAELSSAADSLIVIARPSHSLSATVIKFLMDTGANVSTIPVSSDRSHISEYSAAERSSLRMDKNYLIWDSVVFFNGLS